MRKTTSFRIIVMSCLLGISCLTVSIRAHAAMYSPIAVSLIPPVQLPPSTFGVSGARLSLLWGHNRHVYGLDVGGLGNVTTVQFGGTAISGVFNITHGTTDILGVQLAGIMAIAGGLSIILGYRARYGALLLILFLIPVTLMMHAFWRVSDPSMHDIQQIMFLKNLSMLGGAILIFHFGSGPMSLDNLKRNSSQSKSVVE